MSVNLPVYTQVLHFVVQTNINISVSYTVYTNVERIIFLFLFFFFDILTTYTIIPYITPHPLYRYINKQREKRTERERERKNGMKNTTKL